MSTYETSSSLENVNLYIEKTYTFNTTITRVYAFMKSSLFIKILTIDNTNPFKLQIPQSSSFSSEETIEGIFQNTISLPYTLSISHIIDLPEYKQSKYTMHFSNGNIIKCDINLYATSHQCATYFKATFSNEEMYTIINRNEIHSWFINVLQNIEQLLMVNPIELKQFESTIITAKMNDIWDFVLNMQKLKNVAPMINFNFGCELDVKNIKKGQEIKGYYCCKNDINKKVEYKLRILSFDCRIKSNKWCLAFEIFGCGEYVIPSQVIVIRLIKVNNCDCQLSIYHEFKEAVSQELFWKLANEKKYMLKELKDFLENIKGKECE